MARIELAPDEQILLGNPKDYLAVFPSRIVSGPKLLESLGLGLGNIVRQEYYFKNLENGDTNTKTCKPGSFDPCLPNALVIWYFQAGNKGFLNRENRDALFVSAIGLNGQVVTGGGFGFWPEKKGRVFDQRKAGLMKLIMKYQDNLPAYVHYFAPSGTPAQTEYAS